MGMLSRLILSSLILSTSFSHAMVIVGFDSEPFYFKNGSEGIAGACHEIMQKLCDKEKLHCKFKIAPLAVVLEMMKSGKADATCPLSETEERKEHIEFSDKVFKTRFGFFGTPEIASKVTSHDTLEGLSVGVFTPSRAYESLEEIRVASQAKFEVIKENSNTSALLRADKIAKVLAYLNYEIAARWIEKSKSSLIEAPLQGETLSYGVGFSKKSLSAEKRSQYEKSLQEIISDKDTRESVNKQGLSLWNEEPDSPPAALPTSPPPGATIVPASAPGAIKPLKDSEQE